MKKNPPKEGALTEGPTGIPKVTREIMRERKAELALTNGHSAQNYPMACS
jgi:hypothetical protein